MRLKYQLFLALLVVSALLIALMAGVARFSFDRGFREYIAEVERERLEPLADALADGYARHGNWNWVAEGDHAAWAALTREYGIERGRRGPRTELDDGRGRGRADPRPPPPPGAGPRLTGPRLLLADADRTVLVGRASPDRPVRWQPINLDGETVGHLGHHALGVPSGGIDEAFADRQRRGLLYAAGAMVLFSALLAVPLAGRTVRPLLGVTDAIERIGRGEYAHRVPADRRDEIGDLARDVNRLAGTLETSLAARRRWLAEISHELRTPVAILRGELEAIQDGVQPLDPAAIDSLHDESLRLTRLIDDLHALILSDAGALDYRFETVDLREVVRDRLDAGRGGAAGHAMNIELLPGASPLNVRGDRQRLGQFVDNLLQNSLRYTDEGGTLRVILSREAGRAIIDWSDSAPGVDAEHLPRLFEPLYRVDASRHRAGGGAGLGLAIAARIVEAHGGTVSAHPSPLGGLSIRVGLPDFNGDTT